MKRFLAAFFGLALMISTSGCCCQHLFGGGYGPSCNPCAPCSYGGYPTYSYAPTSYTTTASVAPIAAPACDCAPAVAPY